ncbi:MAG: LysM peptidoglycan-binding domain-containing protein [Thermoleophilaceae bacterium]
MEPALAPAPAPAAATPLAPTGVEQSATASAREALLGSARFHVVQPGDSLWSIAKRLLGRDASPARIAREVDRLWSLNGDRIGTGDPDLLMIGTKLRLR